MSRQDVPQDVPNWTTIRYYFDKWTHDGTGQRIHDRLREQGRRQAGRATEPTAAIIDSQSVKTTEAGGDRGYDGGKNSDGKTSIVVWQPEHAPTVAEQMS